MGKEEKEKAVVQEDYINIDERDLIDYVSERTGLAVATLQKVFDAEYEFLEKSGVIEPAPPEPTEYTMEDLIRCFDNTWEHHAKYIGVLIQIPDQDGLEVIINSSESFMAKKKYYQKMYDNELNHKNVPGLKIVGFTYGNDFAMIEADLFNGGNTNE